MGGSFKIWIFRHPPPFPFGFCVKSLDRPVSGLVEISTRLLSLIQPGLSLMPWPWPPAAAGIHAPALNRDLFLAPAPYSACMPRRSGPDLGAAVRTTSGDHDDFFTVAITAAGPGTAIETSTDFAWFCLSLLLLSLEPLLGLFYAAPWLP